MNVFTASDIRGTWCPLLLQIKERSVLDFSFIDEEISYISASGIHGVYANGSSGEFYNITFSEYCRLIERFASACQRYSIPYQIGANHAHPYESLERIAAAADQAPAAIQLILPDWIPTDRRGTLRFLKGCAKNARGHSLILCNPRHAKTQLAPEDYLWLADEIPELAGLSTYGGDAAWYESMQPVMERLSVFVPGDSLASGIQRGAQGSYSSIAAMNPCAAETWNELIERDMEAGLELERRIQQFMKECVIPFVTEHNMPWHACDKFMAVASGWCGDLHQRLRWPYSWVEDEYLDPVRERGVELIPEFFQRFV